MDKKATEELRKSMNEAYDRLYNSPGMQLLRDQEKNIHPTSYDKEYSKGYNYKYKINK